MRLRPVAFALALVGSATVAHGGEPASFILNWVAGGDHAPYFYAQSLGWYKTAGIDLTLLQGKGSSMAAQAAGAGLHPFGLADLTTVMVAIGKGADEVAVMNVYANYPGGFYWLKSSGITSVKDLAGKKVGNPPGDAARALWPALAKANGVDPDAITWVNLSPNAKLAALKAGTVDAVTEFYNFHHVYKRELGDNIGYQAWKDAGVDPYSNSIVVNGAFLRAHRATVAAFVKVTQKAFAACVADPAPCVQALVEANSGLQPADQLVNWHEVEQLMSDKTSQTTGLGWFDPQRMAGELRPGQDLRRDRETVRRHRALHQHVPRRVDQDEGGPVRRLGCVLNPAQCPLQSESDRIAARQRNDAKGPGCVKSRTDVMILFLNRRAGATNVRLCGRDRPEPKHIFPCHA